MYTYTHYNIYYKQWIFFVQISQTCIYVVLYIFCDNYNNCNSIDILYSYVCPPSPHTGKTYKKITKMQL